MTPIYLPDYEANCLREQPINRNVDPDDGLSYAERERRYNASLKTISFLPGTKFDEGLLEEGKNFEVRSTYIEPPPHIHCNRGDDVDMAYPIPVKKEESGTKAKYEIGYIDIDPDTGDKKPFKNVAETNLYGYAKIITNAFAVSDENPNRDYDFIVVTSDFIKEERQEERMFTKDELVATWDAGYLFSRQWDQHLYFDSNPPASPDKKKYFKTKFGIDV